MLQFELSFIFKENINQPKRQPAKVAWPTRVDGLEEIKIIEIS